MKLIIETDRYTEDDAIEALGAGGLHGLHKYEDYGISVSYINHEKAFDDCHDYIDCIASVIVELMKLSIPFKVEYQQ